MESSWNSHPLLQMNLNLVLSEQPHSEEKHEIPKQYCFPTILHAQCDYLFKLFDSNLIGQTALLTVQLFYNPNYIIHTCSQQNSTRCSACEISSYEILAATVLPFLALQWYS